MAARGGLSGRARGHLGLVSAVSRVKKGFNKPCVPAGVDGSAGRRACRGALAAPWAW